MWHSSQAATEEHEELEPEAWSRHARWSVPCFIRSLPSPSASSPPPAPADDTPIGMKHRFVTLQVHTTTVQRDLELEPTSINFGELAVGQKKVRGLLELCTHLVNGLSNAIVGVI